MIRQLADHFCFPSFLTVASPVRSAVKQKTRSPWGERE